jgi:hypothetical protein
LLISLPVISTSGFREEKSLLFDGGRFRASQTRRLLADGFAESILRNEGLTTWFTLSNAEGLVVETLALHVLDPASCGLQDRGTSAGVTVLLSHILPRGMQFSS